jgi:hypothetical protein
MIYRNIQILIFGSICSVLFLACTEDNTLTINNEDLIFNNSYPIEIPAYNYTDSLGTIYYVQGDTNYILLPDTLNSLPTLAWDSILFELVSVAIFTNHVQISGGEITNSSDIVWQWHSGMEFEKINRIKYSEGKSVINGEIIYGNPATPLIEGNYYWAVWGWNNSGIRVLYSSRQREFYVSE